MILDMNYGFHYYVFLISQPFLGNLIQHHKMFKIQHSLELQNYVFEHLFESDDDKVELRAFLIIHLHEEKVNQIHD